MQTLKAVDVENGEVRLGTLELKASDRDDGGGYYVRYTANRDGAEREFTERYDSRSLAADRYMFLAELWRAAGFGTRLRVGRRGWPRGGES